MAEKAMAMSKSGGGPALKDLPSIASVYMRQLLQLGQRWGAESSDLTNGVGLTRSQLERPEGRVSSRQMGRVAQRIVRHTGRPDVGMAFGMNFRPQDFGMLGHATMSCATLGEAMTVLYKYRNMLLQDVDRTIEMTPRWVILTFKERYDLSATRQTFFESFLVVFYRFSLFLTARNLSDWQVSVDWPEPKYFTDYRPQLCEWQFEQSAIQLRFPRAYLDLPLFMADEAVLHRALEGIDFEQTRRERLNAENVVSQVKALLRPGRQGFPDLKAVSGSLCVSERSLKRRLQEAGTHFQTLLDEARFQMAKNLIGEGKLPLQQISNALGFAEPAAFTRAFRRWAGCSPSQFRRLP